MSLQEREARVKSHLIHGIARVELRVQNIEKALGFYRDIVGLEVAEIRGSSATLRSSGGDAFLRLLSDGVAKPSDPTATGLFHTAVRFPSREALGAALARLVEAGYDVGAGDHIVSEALYIDDPDGNGVELYWDRPIEEWPPPTDDMLVPLATLPVDMDGLYVAGGGPSALGETAPAGTDIGHVHLQVSDVERTIKFYVNTLGLDLTARMGTSAGFFSSNGYHHNIGANAWRSRGAGPASKDRAGLERVAFAAKNAEELNQLRSRLQNAGANFSENGSEVSVADPDGIEFRFTIDTE